MKGILCIFLALTLWITPAYALDPAPLIVGVETFIPPFVLQGANKKLYGYDVDMMMEICKIMQRTCEFRVMRFNQLLDAVISKEIDVAISAITITPERAAKVNFSTPYLLSHSRFLMKRTEHYPTFDLISLGNKTIGIEAGSIFGSQIKAMGIKNVIIKENPKVSSLLEDLESGQLDFILVDNQTALYWEANTSNRFITYGPPYEYGFGFGIAVSPDNAVLLNEINQAILEYQRSDNYIRDFKKYLTQF